MLWVALVVLTLVGGVILKQPEVRNEECRSFRFQTMLARFQTGAGAEADMHLGLQQNTWKNLTTCVCGATVQLSRT